MAGRFTPGSLRRRIMLSAISAPVLPQDTADGRLAALRTAVDGRPHGGVLAVAHHVAGLVVHRHDFGGVADFAPPVQRLAL